MLYIDEAHAFGVVGNKGLGLCRSHPGFDSIDIIVGTFGKAAASMGAFCVMDKNLKDYAINRSRSLIFSTAIPPINCAWTRFIINEIIGMDSQRAHLHELGKLLHKKLTSTGLNTSIEPSHILPVIAGDAKLAVEWSQLLSEHGFKVLPIRTPTVPPGTERLRISLNANLNEEDIIRFAQTIGRII